MSAAPIIAQCLAILGVALIAFTALVRPQLKRMAAHRTFLNSLAIGDIIVTQGGLVGRIEALDDVDLVSLSVAKALSVKIERNCIGRRYGGSAAL